eukprot:TRINITY_DN6794_c0_g1_i1.p1 TRINITY_DN6794_c0_g1~~TRINITY_DN6794_c0_g1_i1.p1  ORF type:complete len:185 (-),score=25.14 TRINITY_DN6794_c0_g1_i1:128-682(-)
MASLCASLTPCVVPAQTVSRISDSHSSLSSSFFSGNGPNLVRLSSPHLSRVNVITLRRQQCNRQRDGCSQTCRASLGDYANVTALVYGASMLGGGLFAYLRTGSKGSLGGGVTGGVVLAVTYFLLQKPETQSLGHALGFGGSLLFSALFAIRLFATKKPVPAGPLLVLSVAAAAVFASAYLGSS